MRSKTKWLYVCHRDKLGEGEYTTVDLLYAGEPLSGIVFRFKERYYAYLNRCVHMPRALNCERNTIFDESGDFLRCSMHGIVYDPETGTSQSTMCHGEKLRSLRLVEDKGDLYIDDKRVTPAPT